MGHGEVHAAAQVLQQGHLGARLVVEGGGLVQDGEVARLAQVGAGAGHQPEGIVVEAGAHVGVAPLGEGLVLVVGAAVGKLDGGDVQDPLPGPLGDQMDEAQQILAAVPEAHAAARAALII